MYNMVKLVLVPTVSWTRLENVPYVHVLMVGETGGPADDHTERSWKEDVREQGIKVGGRKEKGRQSGYIGKVSLSNVIYLVKASNLAQTTFS